MGAKIKTRLNRSKLQLYFRRYISFDHPEQWERKREPQKTWNPTFIYHYPDTDDDTEQAEADCYNHHYQKAIPQHFLNSTPLVLQNCMFWPLALKTGFWPWAASSYSFSELSGNTCLNVMCSFQDYQACEFEGSLNHSGNAQISFSSSQKY